MFKYLLSLAISLMLIAPAQADLVTDLSKRRIDINSTFTGASLLLFGTFTEAFDYDPEIHDIVITVTGPNKPMVLRKKVNKAGIWVNYYQQSYNKMPSYYSVLSTRPLVEISDKPTLGRLGLGTNFLFFDPKEEAQY